MQRILERGQIETLVQREIPRIRLPDRAKVFSARAERLRRLSEGSAIGDYLRVMAVLADAQHAALAHASVTPPTAEQIAQARTHRMPPIHAAGGPRDSGWQSVLHELCEAVVASPDVPPSVVAALNDRLRDAASAHLQAQASALLAAQTSGIDAAAAPFVMAALQVVWTDLASRFSLDEVSVLDVRGVCPTCGTLPAASIVRTDKPYQGYRYLHCALCATEWHMVRVVCSQCQANKDIAYHTIKGGTIEGGTIAGGTIAGGTIAGGTAEGAAVAVRAESCGACRTYRKILYQEADAAVEPVADDLASLALDLLMSEAGYHRGSGNPLLWQPSEA